MIRRLLTTLHSWLGRRLVLSDQSITRKSKRSWFDSDPDTLRAALPHNPDQEEADTWYREHFRINGQPLP